MTMENITLHNQEGKETIEFGQGFSETQIRNFCKFYLTFSGLQIRQTVPAEFNHLEHFLMEMGKGYALVDLKTTKVSYEDVGQMDMYLKLFDTYKRPEGDNPTIGIILCSETNA
ncbi:MAG: PDDEXK nuclease domain-containing protein, partial [Prevotella sp.]|nr:PDDEXK nuclease domain-containing protein [Prevotella sp.]